MALAEGKPVRRDYMCVGRKGRGGQQPWLRAQGVMGFQVMHEAVVRGQGVQGGIAAGAGHGSGRGEGSSVLG